MKSDFPVLYIEIKDNLDLKPILEKSLDSLKDFKKIGLSLAVQHRQDLDLVLNFYNIDAFVELACPRIAIDDYARYEKPILTFREALVAIGEKTWEELLEKGLI